MVKTSHGFVDKSDVNIFRGPDWIFFPVTACHWQVLKLNLTSAFYWVPHVRTSAQNKSLKRFLYTNLIIDLQDLYEFFNVKRILTLFQFTTKLSGQENELKAKTKYRKTKWTRC